MAPVPTRGHYQARCGANRTASCLAFALCIWLIPALALARNPPMAMDPKEGVWIGAGDFYIHQTLDRWNVFSAPATVNKLATDSQTIWIASDDGVIRFDSGSRRATHFTMDQGLPSQSVSSVAVDDQYVWFGTNKGLARYRKLDRAMRVYTEQEGLPHNAVNDVLVVGRQVWFATRGGLAVYDPDVDGIRSFTAADGLAGDDFLELFQLGDDLWCRTDQGLSRLRIKARVFTNFSFKEIGGEQLRTFVIDGDKVWIGTENGLIGYESSSDTFLPFPQQKSLVGKSIVGVETFTDYIFITTDQEVVQFNKLNRSIRRFTEADGLRRHLGATGTLLSGGLFTVMFADGAEVLDVQRDLWSSKNMQMPKASDQSTAWRFFNRLNAEEPLDLTQRGPLKKKLTPDRYATTDGGIGFGQRFQNNRSLDASLSLDYGQLEMSGIRDLRYKVEYLGNNDDVAREIRAEDKLKYGTLEEGLERPMLLQGAHARLASKGAEPVATVTADGGLRRGATMRDFITGPRKDIYNLSQRYILPGTERVRIDGELLTNGSDYSIIYPAGLLAFLDPERVDDLSVIEVEYEYDLMPKKGLGVLSLLDLLPADKEVGDWTRNGEARMISDESGLYKQIDGAAPKYIDRGWARSVYAEYRQGSRTIQVAIHDMGNEINAQSIYNYDLPPAREAVTGRDNVVIDVGLASAYAIKADAGSFYFELSVDEKSDPAKQSLILFMTQVLDRGTNSGANTAQAPREWLAALRVAAAPVRGAEIGARFVELQGIGTPKDNQPLRRVAMGVLDGRYERQVGEGGRLTGYSELAGTQNQRADGADGWGAMGFMRFSHPSLEGTIQGRHDSRGYTSLGSDATLFGKLRDEVRFSATGYPTRWLPTTGFYTRQIATTDDGGTGVVQQALARVQLNKDKLPALSLQLGHTQLDNPEMSTGRMKVVGQADYDLVQGPLAFTGMKRLAIRGLYSISQADTVEGGAFHGDRVELSRLEARASPTNTESAYALFRSRKVGKEDEEGGSFGLRIYHWELNSGARSTIIRGLIPQANYSILYDQDRTGADPVREAKATVAGTLGIYPGQWWSPLTPVVIEPRYSLANDEKSDGEYKSLFQRVHRVDNRAVWAGTRLELEFYQLWEVDLAEQDSHPLARKLELRNRLLVRPTFNSPITFRLNYLGQKSLNDLDSYPSVAPWGSQATYESVIEWLLRWNRTITTKTTTSFSFGRVRDLAPATQSADSSSTSFTSSSTTSTSATSTTGIQNYVQRRLEAQIEWRISPLEDASKLFLIQRDHLYRLFGAGAGATDAVGFDVSLGAIWIIGDKLYLDSEVTFRRMFCLAQSCSEVRAIEPRVLMTLNL